MELQEIETRLAKLAPLDKGAHEADGVACAMEAVAYVAGEPWSDHPACACPILGAFMRAWNDGLPDNERDTLLRPLVPLLVGTKASKETEDRRALMAADWLIRVHTPAWLRLAKLDAQAGSLEALPEITAFAQVPSLRGPLEAVRKDAAAARAAVGDAVGDAVRAGVGAAWAAGAAVGDAAWATAWATAGAAAWDAAVGAAWDAAWDAAWAAVGATAWDALKDTRLTLQREALELVHRMIAA